MYNKPIYFHTGAPAPYRKHQFELIAAAFPKAVFCFSRKVASYRPWSNSIDDWNATIRYVSQWQLIKTLLVQPWGCVHIVGDVGFKSFWFLLMFSGLIGHSKVIKWSDGTTTLGLNKMKLEKTRRKTLKKIFYNWLTVHGIVGVFISGEKGREWARLMGYKDCQVVNAYFSHDVDLFNDYYVRNHEADRNSVRTKLEIANDKVVLLNISRYVDWKRLEDLAEALKIVERENDAVARKCELILIGDGEWRAHLPLLEDLKTVKIHLVRQMTPENVLAYYCAADLFVFPSEGDVWGLVVNEALSMRVPVICTDGIGSSELVQNGVNGYQVPLRAPREIARHIVEVVGDRKLLHSMSCKAAEIRMTWNSAMGVRVLENFLGGHKC